MVKISVQVERPSALKQRLAKKPRKAAASGSAVYRGNIGSIFKGRSAVISHGSLRDRTFQHHLGKLVKLSALRQHDMVALKHGVELTDDVIVFGRDGRRVAPPLYASLRIDQLPQFKKDLEY